MLKLTILVVEDHRLIREMLRDFLSARGGFDVITAGNGREGLELCLQHRPVLVITDNDMPLMTGLELVAAIRAHDEISQTRIIFTSGDTGDIESRALTAGANAFEAKPFDLQKIRQRVAELLTP